VLLHDRGWIFCVWPGNPNSLVSPELPNESCAELVVVERIPLPGNGIKGKLHRAVSEGAFARARVRVDHLDFGPPIGFSVQSG